MTSFSGETIPPEEANEISMWSRIAQRTQNPSLPPDNSQFDIKKVKNENPYKNIKKIKKIKK